MRTREFAWQIMSRGLRRGAIILATLPPPPRSWGPQLPKPFPGPPPGLLHLPPRGAECSTLPGSSQPLSSRGSRRPLPTPHSSPVIGASCVQAKGTRPTGGPRWTLRAEVSSLQMGKLRLGGAGRGFEQGPESFLQNTSPQLHTLAGQPRFSFLPGPLSSSHPLSLSRSQT